MKILLVQDRLRSGGTERQSVLLANAFAAAGHPFTLLTFRPGGALASTVAPSVTRIALQPCDTGLDWLAPGLARAVQRAQPDIVLCMGRMANCYGGALQKRFPATAVVATLRTGKPLPRLFRQSLPRVRHIVANSREARDRLLARQRLPAAAVSVIHNALVFPPVSALARDDALRAAYQAGPDTTVMLCVAMFRPEKNQRELIEIAAGLPPQSDWQLWLAGDGPARAACEASVAAKNLGARVKFPGFHRDPSPLYRAADIAVHASRSESLSNFLIEAQAHGLPAVAGDAQGIRECFVPERTGWAIAPGDRAAFRGALTRLMAEPRSERTLRAAEARTFARTTFDPEHQVSAYLELFRTLVAPPAA